MVDATSIIDYTYEQFRQGVETIARAVEQSKFQPTYIIGVVRGGAIPAVYLSHRLKIPVQMVHWNTRDYTVLDNESNCWIPQDLLDGRKVLIIDDIVDGGDTIKELLADWQQSVRDPLPMENIRIAAMIYNTSQDVTVDFYHKTVDRNEDQRWYVFPWEG